MDGYLKSTSPNWRHIFKMNVRPGGKIPLKDLYEMYGKKYGLSPDDEFINWLRDVKLKNSFDSWEIVTMNDTPPDTSVEVELEAPTDGGTATNVIKKELSVEDVVNLSVRKARKILPNITDLTLLKYALQEARPRAQKDSLCRLLEKRIKEIQIAR